MKAKKQFLPLTDEGKTFIKENCHKMTRTDMARILKASVYDVMRYMSDNDIQYFVKAQKSTKRLDPSVFSWKRFPNGMF